MSLKYIQYIRLDFGSLIFPSFLEVVYHADILFFSLFDVILTVHRH